MCSCDYKTPRDYNQPLHTKKRTGQWAILKFGPPWLINGGGELPDQSTPIKKRSHAVNTTRLKPHTELWFWQTSDRDSPIRFCWFNTHYNHTNWIIEYFAAAFAPTLLWLAVSGLWFCTDRFVTLPSQTWLCNHRFGLAVLVQSWISKENNWSIDIKKTFWKMTWGSSHRVPPMTPCPPK